MLDYCLWSQRATHWHMHGKNLKISDEKQRFHHNLTFEIVNNTEITQSIAVVTKRKIWGDGGQIFSKIESTQLWQWQGSGQFIQTSAQVMGLNGT